MLSVASSPKTKSPLTFKLPDTVRSFFTKTSPELSTKKPSSAVTEFEPEVFQVSTLFSASPDTMRDGPAGPAGPWGPTKLTVEAGAVVSLMFTTVAVALGVLSLTVT